MASDDILAGLGVGALCLAVLVSCTLLPAFLMWIIWGSMIVDDSSNMTEIESCRARDFWWHMCSAYIGIGAMFVLNCCFRCASLAFSKGQEIAIFLGLLIQMLFTWVWSVYAITLWAEFDNNPDNIPDKFADCEAFLTHISTYDDLITLWKVTAIWYWILSIIFVVLLAVGIYCIGQFGEQSKRRDTEEETPAEMSEPLLGPEKQAVTHVGADVAQDGVDPDIANRTNSMNDDVTAALGLGEPATEEHSAIGDDVEEEPAAEEAPADFDPLLQVSAPDPADTPAPTPDEEVDDKALEQL